MRTTTFGKKSPVQVPVLSLPGETTILSVKTEILPLQPVPVGEENFFSLTSKQIQRLNIEILKLKIQTEKFINIGFIRFLFYKFLLKN